MILNAILGEHHHQGSFLVWAMMARFIVMGDQRLDIEMFHRWAMGDLVDNRNRGIFAEWLVGQALEVIRDGDKRREWDAYDLCYKKKIKVEVKASGRSQAWPQGQPSKPEFNIAPRWKIWVAKTNEWIEHNPPVRFADVYVFCLHYPEEATNENVRDPASWKFWVISKQTLNDKLGDQKSVGVRTLDELADHVGWSEIKAEVDRLELA